MLLAICYAPLALSLIIGQMSAVTVLLLALVARDEWRSRSGVRTGAIAGLALYKPQLLLPLIACWIVGRRWRPLAGFSLAALAVLIASWLVSPTATRQYVSEAPRLFALVRSHVVGRGSAAVLFSETGPPWVAFVILTGALLAMAWLRHPRSRFAWAALWLMPLLTTPYMGVYDLMLGLIGISFLAPVVPSHRILALLVGACWAAPFGWLAGMAYLPSAVYLALFVACVTLAILRVPDEAAGSPISHESDAAAIA